MSDLSPVTPEQRLPTTLVTGFLGSGKTTLINRLLRQSDFADTAVIVNEFGDIGIDNVLLEKVDSTTALLESGCVCCTVRDELATTMQELLERRERGEIPRFERLVIETTGMADPGPIARLLMTDPVVATRYALASVVTTIDAVNGLHTLDHHVEAAKQTATADRIVLTKTDLADGEAVAALLAAVSRLNPSAPVLRAAEEPLDDTLLASAAGDVVVDARPPAQEDAHAHGGDHGHLHHDHDIETFYLVRDEPIGWTRLARFLRLLDELAGDDLLRVKGLVNVTGATGGPAVIHGVQRIIHVPTVLPEWPDDDRRSRIVFITHGLPRERLERLLDEAAVVS